MLTKCLIFMRDYVSHNGLSIARYQSCILGKNKIERHPYEIVEYLLEIQCLKGGSIISYWVPPNFIFTQCA